MSNNELKLQIAGQCLAGILANSSPYSIDATNEQLAKLAWDAATALVELSKEEEEKKIKKKKVVQIVEED